MIITDTGAFVALLSERDEDHAIAQRAFINLSEGFITTYPVITETCYLLARSVSQTAARTFLQSITRNAAEVFHIQNSHLERMIVLMQKYEDLPMDFADASLVLLAEELGHGRILTTDKRDFSVYRWREAQPFDNLLR
jgi:predicted nucleic acid-binding protein